ncbi:glycerophosphodiester phosphodiesterase [Lysobacter psychrotolerans]|uniref:glycerophosphodiester phosphodiesterase n=2 Tax=Montanilutibacter psychrotolerans TaxID=1327343 RepID=A0A3M8T1E2_9GAMM|nr:glycerophosphodiester phosphodiesterase [Lysobacter psychrotolerans]
MPEHAPAPIVIGHRGASGHRPEHTLEAYQLAIEQGADFIEPDLVATRDGVLVARHENEISGTTDVAAHPEFAERRTSKRVDGVETTGWFTEDFTLAELKTLRARERIPAIRPGNADYDGQFRIATFAEVIDLVRHAERAGRRVGLYVETKHPTYFASEGQHLDGSPIGVDLGAALVAELVRAGFTDPARVYIQSFELSNLIGLRQRVMPAAGVDFPLVQLFDELASARPYDLIFHSRRGDDLETIYPGLARQLPTGLGADTGYASLAAPAVLAWARRTYARGIGPWKADLLPRRAAPGEATGEAAQRATRQTGAVHPMLADAHRAGLLVHPYTLRAEEAFLGEDVNGERQSVVDEAVQLFELGVDGAFFDQPDLGVLARDVWQQGRASR